MFGNKNPSEFIEVFDIPKNFLLKHKNIAQNSTKFSETTKKTLRIEEKNKKRKPVGPPSLGMEDLPVVADRVAFFYLFKKQFFKFFITKTSPKSFYIQWQWSTFPRSISNKNRCTPWLYIKYKLLGFYEQLPYCSHGKTCIFRLEKTIWMMQYVDEEETGPERWLFMDGDLFLLHTLLNLYLVWFQINFTIWSMRRLGIGNRTCYHLYISFKFGNK